MLVSVLPLPVNGYTQPLKAAPPGPNRASRTAANDALCRVVGMMLVLMMEASCLACGMMCMKRAIPRELLRWGQTGSTNFDYVDHVFDSVDVLLSTRGAEIVVGSSQATIEEDTDVPEEPSDLKLDVRAGTWVLPNVPGTFFLSYLLGLIRGLYRQTKYVLGPSDSIIYEYAIVINMACGGALVMAL